MGLHVSSTIVWDFAYCYNVGLMGVFLHCQRSGGGGRVAIGLNSFDSFPSIQHLFGYSIYTKYTFPESSSNEEYIKNIRSTLQAGSQILYCGYFPENIAIDSSAYLYKVGLTPLTKFFSILHIFDNLAILALLYMAPFFTKPVLFLRALCGHSCCCVYHSMIYFHRTYRVYCRSNCH